MTRKMIRSVATKPFYTFVRFAFPKRDPEEELEKQKRLWKGHGPVPDDYFNSEDEGPTYKSQRKAKAAEKVVERQVPLQEMIHNSFVIKQMAQASGSKVKLPSFPLVFPLK